MNQWRIEGGCRLRPSPIFGGLKRGKRKNDRRNRIQERARKVTEKKIEGEWKRREER